MIGNNRHWLKYFFLFIGIAWLVSSCEDTIPDNPFDPYNQGDTTGTVVDTIDPNSFVGLHKNIFFPTCANSGCHDGTFEPDFRTVESAYNSLVYHPIIKNNNAGTYVYRVVPVDASNSILYVRITEDLNGNSGIMPLEIEPESDWPEKKDQYIENVRTWIQNGAKDMLGNDPVMSNMEPQMMGAQAYANGSNTALNRQTNRVIIVPNTTTTLDIWFALKDDVTAVSNLQHNKVKFSLSMDDFSAATEQSLTIVGSPKSDEGFSGGIVSYYHKVTVNPYSLWPAGSTVFMRIYVQDEHNDITEVPEYSSSIQVKTYFTLQLE